MYQFFNFLREGEICVQDNESQLLRISRAIGNCSLNIDQFTSLSAEEILNRLNIHKNILEDTALEVLRSAVEIESERKYFRNIFFESALPFIVIDRLGRICLSNKSFDELAGTDRQRADVYLHNLADNYVQILNLFTYPANVSRLVIRSGLMFGFFPCY